MLAFFDFALTFFLDVARFQLILVDQISIRAAIPRANSDQLLFGLVRVGSSATEQAAARAQADMALLAGYDGVAFVGIERMDEDAKKKFLKMLNKFRDAWAERYVLIVRSLPIVLL